MATTTFSFSSNAAAAVITDTDSDTTVEANVASGGGNILQVTIDNSANTVPHTTVLWDSTSVITYDGSTWDSGPQVCLLAPASTSQTYIFPQGIKFENGISFATTTAGGSQRGSAPSSNVTVTIMVAAADLASTP